MGKCQRNAFSSNRLSLRLFSLCCEYLPISLFQTAEECNGDVQLVSGCGNMFPFPFRCEQNSAVTIMTFAFLSIQPKR
ncbi:hypothetical protein POVWA2_015950 [Plasmodium ovale wallikeri]|uniref:Uncharacterized protein n=1 Tax=Plasmodium ovale wallikeri TaxID=864142 RepID=A0A1A8YPZ9_PLAOA|nr:hypothetical protein POVWA2_015950 [Plasmodium ovale wallikeri]SBT38261.1 hypothetical protein POVWA1_037780 [Plasmodium ovale wallikeri]